MLVFFRKRWLFGIVIELREGQNICSQIIFLKKTGMRMKRKKYKLIFLLVVFMMGLSITGWSISTHYGHTFINGELQNEKKNDSQTGNAISGVFSNNSPILLLITTGMIGLFGVRRQRKKMEISQPKDNINNELARSRPDGIS